MSTAPVIVTQKQLESSAEYHDWLYQSASSGCWACRKARPLERHHICKPRRYWNLCNLALLCRFCHAAAENERIVHQGVRWPRLTLANVLWLKRENDPAHFDLDALAGIFAKALPDLEQPDKFYMSTR